MVGSCFWEEPGTTPITQTKIIKFSFFLSKNPSHFRQHQFQPKIIMTLIIISIPQDISGRTVTSRVKVLKNYSKRKGGKLRKKVEILYRSMNIHELIFVSNFSLDNQNFPSWELIFDKERCCIKVCFFDLISFLFHFSCKNN